MAEKNKHPSLPSNYVSIHQLRERWLKEQQQKKEQEGQEDEKGRRVEQVLEEERETKEDSERCEEPKFASINPRPYRRNWGPNDRPMVEMSRPKIYKSEAVVVAGEEQVLEEERENQKTEEDSERCEEVNSTPINLRPYQRNWRRDDRRMVKVSRPKPDEAEANAKAVVVAGEEKVLKKERENQKTEEDSERCEEVNSTSINRRPYRRNWWCNDRRKVKVSHPKPDEAEANVVAVVMAGEEQVFEEERKNQKTEEDLERYEEVNSTSINLRPYRRYWGRNDRRKVKVSRPKPDEAEAKAKGVVVAAGEEIGDEERNSIDNAKKKKKWKKNKGKSKEDEEAIGDTDPVLVRAIGYTDPVTAFGDTEPVPGILEIENLGARRDGAKKGKRQWRAKDENVVDEVLNDKHAELEENPMVRIERKFEDLSVNRGQEEAKERSRLVRFPDGGGGGSYRSSGRFGGGRYWGSERLGGGRYWGSGRFGDGRYWDSGRFGGRGRERWNPRTEGLVWVQKGAVSDSNVARGAQENGSCSMAMATEF